MTSPPVSPTTTSKTAVPAGMDEEADWSGFRGYLAALPPDSLWDVYRHVDVDRFPRRREAIEREMTRRGLFFVSPFAAWEQKTRLLHLNLGVFAFLAAVLHLIPHATGALNRALLGLNNDTPLLSPTGQAVSLVSGLTPREAEVVNGLRTLFGVTAAGLWVVSVALLPLLMKRRRVVHRDVLIGAVVALAGGGLLLCLLRL